MWKSSDRRYRRVDLAAVKEQRHVKNKSIRPQRTPFLQSLSTPLNFVRKNIRTTNYGNTRKPKTVLKKKNKNTSVNRVH